MAVQRTIWNLGLGGLSQAARDREDYGAAAVYSGPARRFREFVDKLGVTDHLSYLASMGEALGDDDRQLLDARARGIKEAANRAYDEYTKLMDDLLHNGATFADAEEAAYAGGRAAYIARKAVVDKRYPDRIAAIAEKKHVKKIALKSELQSTK